MNPSEQARREILGEASAVDTEVGTASADPKGPGAAGPEEGARKTLTTEQNIAAVLNVLMTIIGPILPTVKEVYNANNIKAIAENTAPLIDKYGWQALIAFGRWEPELKAASVLIPVAVATVQAAKMDIDRLRKMGQAMSKSDEAKDKPSEEGGTKAPEAKPE